LGETEISFTSIKIENLESYKKLLKYVPEYLIDEDVIDSLMNNLGIKCDEIRLEYPYYDTDYLSTFYIHYAQKLRTYEKRCCRLHILKKEEYYGYIVLRPTVAGTKLGRTLIDPRILIDKKAYIALHDFEAHIAGNQMSINSFPWKSQETDISVCAHTATWTVLRYFGNKFKNYADTTIGEIVNITNNDWGRKTPSIGLNPVQVSDIFKKFSFSPLILQCEKELDNKFIDEVMAYIESGLPMVGFLYPRRHAVSIVGHGLMNLDILDDAVSVQSIMDSDIGVVPHARLINDAYVMDDNIFPYKRMKIGWADEESDVKYGFAELKYCVVPLYNRMQLVYNEVYARFKTWMLEHVMDWETPCVSRIYITSANSLKQKALEANDMNEQLVEVILNLSLPRFVWCIDLANFNEYKEGLTSGRIIIDTTAPTLDEEPWILRHDKNRIEYIDIDENILSSKECSSIKTTIQPYKMYQNNLIECNVEGGEKKDE
jgi:hypothetical protein